jgi:tetratricopeptide (TPR) repeat protein
MQRAQQALQFAAAVGRRDIEADALLALARAGLRDEDPISVRLHASDARKIALELTDDDRELSAIHPLAEGARMAGDLDEARTLYAESLERNRARGAQLMVAVELTNLGYVEKASGRLDFAEAGLREAIPISLSIGNSYILAHSLVALSAIVAASGRADESARLLGKADSIFTETGLMLDPADKPEYEAAIATARATLGDEAYEAAYATGAALDPSLL